VLVVERPLRYRSPPELDRSKKGPRPLGARHATAIMMALANNAATSNCTLQAVWLKETFNK
jgi:hypothetical protein